MVVYIQVAIGFGCLALSRFGASAVGFGFGFGLRGFGLWALGFSFGAAGLWGFEVGWLRGSRWTRELYR